MEFDIHGEVLRALKELMVLVLQVLTVPSANGANDGKQDGASVPHHQHLQDLQHPHLQHPWHPSHLTCSVIGAVQKPPLRRPVLKNSAHRAARERDVPLIAVPSAFA